MAYINTASRHVVSEERKVSSERSDRMRAELESMDVRLEEERKRSAELLLQVTYSLSIYLRIFERKNELNVAVVCNL